MWFSHTTFSFSSFSRQAGSVLPLLPCLVAAKRPLCEQDVSVRVLLPTWKSPARSQDRHLLPEAASFS
jgi:hypothetical protein